MSTNYVRFDKTDIQAIIGLIDEIAPEDRTEQEDTVFAKACAIAELQANSIERVKPELTRDPTTGRLSIVFDRKISDPVGYKGIAKLGNLFAVTDYFKDSFPTNVLLRFFHANPAERLEFERSRAPSPQSLDELAEKFGS